MKKNILTIVIMSLFIVSSVIPMVAGVNIISNGREELLEKLVFSYPGKYNSSILSDYKYLLNKNNFNYFEPEKAKINSISSSKTTLNGPMNSAWPMQSHDTYNTGRSPYNTADTSEEIWRFYSSGAVEGTPVIDNNGIIYFKGAYNYLDRYIYAIYPNGSEKWKYKTDGLIEGSSPAISEDGTIYFGSWDGGLYALNPDGSEKWRFGAGSQVASSPVIADDGTIYFGIMGPGNDGRIYAINSDGTEKWYYDTGYWIVSDPAIGNDGTIYIGSGDTYLYAIWPNGSLRWRFKTDDYIKGSPSIADDGTIYIGSYDAYFYAINPDGSEKWRFNSVGVADNAAAIASDGTIYIGTNKLYARYPDGSEKWTFNLGTDRWVGWSSPAVSADGIIYIGTHIGDAKGGDIIAINPDGTERWRKIIATQSVGSSPSIAEDGTVYIGSWYDTSEGYLHAFGVGEIVADADGPYYGLISQPIQFIGASSGGYLPHSYHWDFGDSHTTEEQNPIHTYTNPGNYEVVLTVTDNEQNTATDTTYAWIQETNTPPNKPTINGPTNGKPGIPYPYTFTATDPDESVIRYFIDWGDNTNSGWLGPCNSGETITQSHAWSTQGTFDIKAKAKDPYNEEGPWGELKVTMPRNKIMNKPFFNFLENHLNIFSIFRYLLGL